MARYSAQIRNVILKKLLPPENRTAASLAKEFSISVSTIYEWKAKLNHGTLHHEEGVLSNHDRPLAEKLMLLLESRTIDDASMGSWLRERGLHSQHLIVWELEVRDAVTKREQEVREELKAAKKKIREQERELARKDKALAEAAIIITTQKNFCTAAGAQGRLIPVEERIKLIHSIDTAVAQGVRLAPVCSALGIHRRTYTRWKRDPQDKRTGSTRCKKRTLTAAERQDIIEVCTSDRFKDSSPGEIVAILAEEGKYIASERSFCRVLKDAGLLHHRRNSRPARRSHRPPELKATGPDQVYCWDITWLPSQVHGLFWYCYTVIDVWSREIVGWAIHENEYEQHAHSLFESIRQRRKLEGVWLHADNGNPSGLSGTFYRD